MGRKKHSKGLVALDQNGQKVEVGTPLMVAEGQYIHRVGVVKHIFKVGALSQLACSPRSSLHALSTE